MVGEGDKGGVRVQHFFKLTRDQSKNLITDQNGMHDLVKDISSSW